MGKFKLSAYIAQGSRWKVERLFSIEDLMKKILNDVLMRS